MSISSLEARLGRTRAAEDGRVRRVRLTAKGTATWAKMLVNIRAYYKAAIANFTTDEGLLLFRLLDRLLTGLNRL